MSETIPPPENEPETAATPGPADPTEIPPIPEKHAVDVPAEAETDGEPDAIKER